VHRAWQADENSDDVPLCDDSVIIPSMDHDEGVFGLNVCRAMNLVAAGFLDLNRQFWTRKAMFLHVESTQHHPNHAQSDRITGEQKSLTLSKHGYFDGLSILFRVRIPEDFVT
jgi:hypothetical protein